jgi:hypothetical protein
MKKLKQLHLIVCIHGTPDSLLNWQTQIHQLAGCGLNLLNFTNFGRDRTFPASAQSSAQRHHHFWTPRMASLWGQGAMAAPASAAEWQELKTAGKPRPIFLSCKRVSNGLQTVGVTTSTHASTRQPGKNQRSSRPPRKSVSQKYHGKNTRPPTAAGIGTTARPARVSGPCLKPTKKPSKAPQQKRQTGMAL